MTIWQLKIKTIITLILFFSNIAFADTSEFLLKKVKKLANTKDNMVEIESLDDNLSETGEIFISMKNSIDTLCMPSFNKELSNTIGAMKQFMDKKNYEQKLPVLIDVMKEAENSVMKCGARKGMLVRPYIVTEEGNFTHSSWLQSSLFLLQALEVSTKERDELAAKSKSQILSRVQACGRSYNYDVDGRCGGESVDGNVDACSNSRIVTGTVEYSNGKEFDFTGRWVSSGVVEGHDSFGNRCELEVN